MVLQELQGWGNGFWFWFLFLIILSGFFPHPPPGSILILLYSVLGKKDHKIFDNPQTSPISLFQRLSINYWDGTVTQEEGESQCIQTKLPVAGCMVEGFRTVILFAENPCQ